MAEERSLSVARHSTSRPCYEDCLKAHPPIGIAARLHPNDKRRIIRALEVYKLTGQPISHLQFQFESDQKTDWCRVLALRWPRQTLHERIEARVEQMFAEGLVNEVETLLGKHGQLGHTASQAVGYREVIELLDGQRDLAETVEAVKVRTRQFARRQETWFRSLPECQFIEQLEPSSPMAIVDRLLKADPAPL